MSIKLVKDLVFTVLEGSVRKTKRFKAGEEITSEDIPENIYNKIASSDLYAKQSGFKKECKIIDPEGNDITEGYEEASTETKKEDGSGEIGDESVSIKKKKRRKKKKKDN